MNTSENNNQVILLKKTVRYSFYFLSISMVGFITLAIGMNSAINKDPLFQLALNVKKMVTPPESVTTQNTNEYGQVTNEFAQLVKDPTKLQIPAPAITDKTIVAFVFGQSNSANSGGERFQANSDNVFNYFDNHYYIASTVKHLTKFWTFWKSFTENQTPLSSSPTSPTLPKEQNESSGLKMALLNLT